MQKKRILIFSTSYYPFVGGAEIAIKEIAERSSSYFDFDLITARLDTNLPETEMVGNITVFRLGSGSFFFDRLLLPFRGMIKTWQLLRTHEYALMWGMMVSFATGAAYLTNIARAIVGRPKIPIVLTLQEGDSEEHLRYRWAGLLSLSTRLALRYASFVTALSSFLLHRAELLGYTGRKKLVPNGVDITRFSRLYAAEEQAGLLAALSKKEGDVFLVTTSRLVSKNAVDDSIHSLTYLPAHVRLLVIGVGEEGPALSTLAKSLGLSDRVMFVGFVPHEELPLYLSISDIFVRPSRSEGFGNSFIEAMAARLPVVATPVGGIPDFLDDKETGIFCAPDNPKSVADSVELLLSNSALTHRIVQNAFARVSLRYDWSVVSQEMRDVFTDVLP